MEDSAIDGIIRRIDRMTKHLINKVKYINLINIDLGFPEIVYTEQMIMDDMPNIYEIFGVDNIDLPGTFQIYNACKVDGLCDDRIRMVMNVVGNFRNPSKPVRMNREDFKRYIMMFKKSIRWYLFMSQEYSRVRHINYKYTLGDYNTITNRE